MPKQKSVIERKRNGRFLRERASALSSILLAYRSQRHHFSGREQKKAGRGERLSVLPFRRIFDAILPWPNQALDENPADSGRFVLFFRVFTRRMSPRLLSGTRCIRRKSIPRRFRPRSSPGRNTSARSAPRFCPSRRSFSAA